MLSLQKRQKLWDWPVSLQNLIFLKKEKEKENMSSIASKEKVLQFSEIRKNFGGLAALDGVSLAIDEGTITVVIGPNGSGKTTLINVLTGFYRPDAGAITYKG